MSVRVLIAAMALCSLPGCVVWEIRDEMRGANAHLTEVKQTLDTVNSSLAAANQALADANARLDEVDVGLARIDKTNIELERLAMLSSIDESLGRLDTHLASVRKTIGAIDTMIPFFDLGADEPITEPPAAEGVAVAEVEVVVEATEGGEGRAGGGAVVAAEAGQPGVEGEAGNGAGGAAGAEQRPAQRRDPLPGVWVQRYPDVSVAMVLLSDGRYLRSTSSAASGPVQEGQWAREGNDIVFTPFVPPAPAATPPPVSRTGTASPATPAAPTTPWRMSIVSSSLRMLTLRSESGALAIFGRP
jgi:hypothetical protein